MRCRPFCLLILILAIRAPNNCCAQEDDTPEPYPSGQELKVRSDTALISRYEGPSVSQQSDISLNCLTDLQFHLYTLHTVPLGQSEEGITSQSIIYPDTVGLEISAQKGNFRILYGSLSLGGLENRLQNIWNKALLLPLSYAISAPRLKRSTSAVQKQDMAGYVTLLRGPRTMLYSCIHLEDPQNINTILGFQIYQIDEWTLDLESLLCSRMLPESHAETWFSSHPFVPERRQMLSAFGLKWEGPRASIAGDAAISWTEWEGLGWYYKGSFSFGPPAFRFSGGAESIQGNFRDSGGTAADNNSRGRLELSLKSRNFGSVILNMETMYANNDTGYPAYLEEIAGALAVSKGRLFRSWWLMPDKLKLETGYKESEATPYFGAMNLTFTEGGTKAGFEQTGSLSLRSGSPCLQPGVTALQTRYSLSIQGHLQMNRMTMQAETGWKKDYNESIYGNASIKVSYTQENLRISGSLDVPVYNNDSCKATISVVWQR
ncbi:MAG: hypothetical protein LDL24_10770 [Treponema sp.]|nr:hypothetical protein [Treponema sp.]